MGRFIEFENFQNGSLYSNPYIAQIGVFIETLFYYRWLNITTDGWTVAKSPHIFKSQKLRCYVNYADGEASTIPGVKKSRHFQSGQSFYVLLKWLVFYSDVKHSMLNICPVLPNIRTCPALHLPHCSSYLLFWLHSNSTPCLFTSLHFMYALVFNFNKRGSNFKFRVLI